MAKLPPADPRFVQALRQLEQAVQCQRTGQAAEAEALFARLVKKNPEYFDALNLYGVFKYQQGQPEQALKLLTRATALKPRSVGGLNNLGVVLNALRRSQDSLAAFERALAVDANNPQTLINRGNALAALGRLDEALASFDRANALQPNHPDIILNRGNTLVRLGRFEEALAGYAPALAANPMSAQLHNARGAALQRLLRAEEALASFDRALAIDPGFLEALKNRGVALHSLARMEDALANHKRVLALTPNDHEVRYDIAVTLLMLGRYAEGWREYESRWQSADHAHRKRSFPQPLWLGDRPVAGKTVLLHAEQGFGDGIKFVRYAPLVARMGARVIVEAPEPLRALFQTLDGVAQVVARGQPLPPFDLNCPLLSLPLAFRTTLDTVPANVPYLRAPSALIAKWQARLPQSPPRRVGVVWSARPYPPHRAMPLAALAPLRSLTNLVFVSLQPELPEEELRLLTTFPNFLHFGAEIGDFADTAAIIASLDLVICVDTAVAHLAGALGKPFWVMLPFNVDFRWLLDRADSPWYPTARLYRQARAGVWADVIDRVGHALADLR